MLTKSQIVNHVAKDQNISKAAAERVLDSFTLLVTDTLKAGEEVKLSGIGTLKVADRPARTGRNPATGAELEIPASKVVKLSVTKDLKEALN